MSGYKHNEMSQSGIDSKTYINIKIMKIFQIIQKVIIYLHP